MGKRKGVSCVGLILATTFVFIAFFVSLTLIGMCAAEAMMPFPR